MDYKKLGFKAGLEIHQQLAGKKLFCDCEAINSDKEPNREVRRKLRAVIGETGDVDTAAAHEMAKGHTFTYIGNSEDTCAVEFDDEPPRPIQEDHIETAILVSKMLNAEVVDEVQVMRKTVVDGSNVAGFQRTMLIGRNGSIETDKGTVGIPTIFLEEEAAQKGKGTKKGPTYKVDRLGIALLEISTDASLKDPQHAKEVAAHIGMVLRSTGKVKRGIGTIRQDVNLSIQGGNRVEIKGFQDLKSIPKVMEGEIQRQQELLKKKELVKNEVRKAEADCSTTFLRPMPGAARLYPETDCLPITITEDMKNITPPKLLEEQIQEIEKKYNLSTPLAKEVVAQGIDLESYPDLSKDLVAHIRITIPKDIKKRLNIDSSTLKEEDFQEVMKKILAKDIPKDAATEVLALKAEGKNVDYAQFTQADANEVETYVKKIMKEKPGLSPGAYMGLIMKAFKGNVDGKEVMSLVQKQLR